MNEVYREKLIIGIDELSDSDFSIFFKDTKEYDGKIARLALARTSIDLDDGMNVNYEKSKQIEKEITIM